MLLIEEDIVEMARIKAKKKEISVLYPLQHKNDKVPCHFQKIEKYLDFLVNITKKSNDIKINRYGNDKKCVWILFGKSGDEYIALQVGEVAIERAVNEIVSDIDAMYSKDEYSFGLMSDEEELTIIDTEFYKNTYAVKDEKKKRSYAYRKMRDDFEELLIYQLRIDEYLGLDSGLYANKECENVRSELIEMTKSYYAEAKLAYETQARYWNPYYSGVGYESLKLIKQL